MSFDAASYIMGQTTGKGVVVIEDTETYTFTDPDSDGNVVIDKDGE